MDKQKNDATATETGIDYATKVKADYEAWREYARPYWLKAVDNGKLYRNERVRRKYKGGVSDSFDPMTHQMVETTVDNVYGSRPTPTFMKTMKDQDADVKLLRAMWDYNWDQNRMDDKIIAWGRATEISGNEAIFGWWEDSMMRMRHVPFRDCIFDSSVASPEDMKFAGFRRLAMKDDLKKDKRFDPLLGKKDENGEPVGEWVKKYSDTALDDLQCWGQDGDMTDKQMKDVYAGSLLKEDARGGQIEVIYMMYLDKIVEVGNRQKLIQQGGPIDNPYRKDAYPVKVQLKDERSTPVYNEDSIPEEDKQLLANGIASGMVAQEDVEGAIGESYAKEMITVQVPEIKPFLPVFFNRGYVDSSLLLAKANVSTFAEVQEDLNDALNVSRDDMIQKVSPKRVIDKLAATDIPMLSRATPGAYIPVQGGIGSIANLEVGEAADASQLEINRAKNSIRDTARVSEVVQGNDSATDKTATEVNAQVSQATSGFAIKTRSLESGPYYDMAMTYWKMCQIFLTEEQTVRVLGPNGTEFRAWDPSSNWGPLDVNVVLETSARAKEKEEAEKAMQLLATFKGDLTINQTELKKLVIKKAFSELDQDDVDLLLTPDPAMQMPMSQPGMMPGMAQPGIVPMQGVSPVG